jgi:hypothetical protein
LINDLRTSINILVKEAAKRHAQARQARIESAVQNYAQAQEARAAIVQALIWRAVGPYVSQVYEALRLWPVPLDMHECALIAKMRLHDYGIEMPYTTVYQLVEQYHEQQETQPNA